ncbi:Hypothetical predicted protein [Marmota monax]|uniref:Uncharacterized protein n=1 Tax=Marmota monax TaxID=9995 RepID=A0A5E4BAB8_MARMO|nr:Hypothetical predicted protein [Marmota monax]
MQQVAPQCQSLLQCPEVPPFPCGGGLDSVMRPPVWSSQRRSHLGFLPLASRVGELRGDKTPKPCPGTLSWSSSPAAVFPARKAGDGVFPAKQRDTYRESAPRQRRSPSRCDPPIFRGRGRASGHFSASALGAEALGTGFLFLEKPRPPPALQGAPPAGFRGLIPRGIGSALQDGWDRKTGGPRPQAVQRIQPPSSTHRDALPQTWLSGLGKLLRGPFPGAPSCFQHEDLDLGSLHLLETPTPPSPQFPSPSAPHTE